MTSKKVYESILMELRKVKAPHLHLEEFNYYINKGIQEYINTAYKTYETTQQTSDDLSAVSENVSGIITNTVTYSGQSFNGSKPLKTGTLYNSSYTQFQLPDNYMHLLGITPTLVTKRNYKCYKAGYEYSYGADKLTADFAGAITNNAFFRPSFRQSYYRIIDSSNNTSGIPDIQIFYGDSIKFKFKDFYLSYIKKPQVIDLTVRQVDLPTDTSQLMEFPDYVCNEIIKRIVILLLENSQNPRLQTYIPVNKSIDNLSKQ